MELRGGADGQPAGQAHGHGKGDLADVPHERTGRQPASGGFE